MKAVGVPSWSSTGCQSAWSGCSTLTSASVPAKFGGGEGDSPRFSSGEPGDLFADLVAQAGDQRGDGVIGQVGEVAVGLQRRQVALGDQGEQNAACRVTQGRSTCHRAICCPEFRNLGVITSCLNVGGWPQTPITRISSPSPSKSAVLRVYRSRWWVWAVAAINRSANLLRGCGPLRTAAAVTSP